MRTALSAIPFVSYLFFVDVPCMIPRKIFTGFAKFQGIVSVNDLFPFWLQELLQATLVFPVTFLYYTDTTGSIH